MKHQTRLSLVFMILWGVVLVVLCSVGLHEALGQDAPQPITTLFTFSCFMTDEHYADVLMTSDGVEHYTFANEDGIDTTIPSDFTTSAGVYPLGHISIYGTYDLSFIRDDGAIATLAMTPDWQTWCDKEATPPEGIPEATEPPPPTDAPIGAIYNQPTISIVKMCVVKYPQVILVCTPYGN